MRKYSFFPRFFPQFLFWAILAFVIAFFGVKVQAFAQQGESKFQDGLTAFQKNDFPAARTAFVESLKENQNSPTALFDLGLVEYKQGHNGEAIALWRKALALKPGYFAAENAIAAATKKLDHSEIAHDVELWERARPNLFQHVSFFTYLVTALVLLVLGGALLLRFLGARRRAVIDERPSPGFPILATVFTLLFVIFGLLSALKVVDESDLRATITEKKIEARSTPDVQSTPLFDLYEGLEVIVQNQKEDWLQVTYPGGPTGWIPKSSALTLNDRVEK